MLSAENVQPSTNMTSTLSAETMTKTDATLEPNGHLDSTGMKLMSDSQLISDSQSRDEGNEVSWFIYSAWVASQFVLANQRVVYTL